MILPGGMDAGSSLRPLAKRWTVRCVFCGDEFLEGAPASQGDGCPHAAAAAAASPCVVRHVVDWGADDVNVALFDRRARRPRSAGDTANSRTAPPPPPPRLNDLRAPCLRCGAVVSSLTWLTAECHAGVHAGFDASLANLKAAAAGSGPFGPNFPTPEGGLPLLPPLPAPAQPR